MVLVRRPTATRVIAVITAFSVIAIAVGVSVADAATTPRLRAMSTGVGAITVDGTNLPPRAGLTVTGRITGGIGSGTIVTDGRGSFRLAFVLPKEYAGRVSFIAEGRGVRAGTAITVGRPASTTVAPTTTRPPNTTSTRPTTTTTRPATSTTRPSVPTTTPPSSSQFACTAAGAASTTVRQATGATPNDSSDDTAAIQSAINAAGSAGGGVVSLPPGRFVINGHLVMKTNVKLTGAGPTTILKAGPNFLSSTGPAGGYPVVTTAGASNVTIANLTADQSGDVLDGNRGGRLTEYLIDVRNSRNAVVDGVHTRNPFTYSITVVGSTNFCVKNSNTLVTSRGRYNQLDGIHILNSNNGVVTGNHVDQGAEGGDGDDGLVAHTINGTVHDVVYANNKVRGGSHGAGMQFAFTGQEIFNIRVINNEFWGNPMAIHNGVYGGLPGLTRDVVISGNKFDRITRTAVDFEGDVRNLTVTNNAVCTAAVTIPAGNGNTARNNTTGCA